MRVLLTDEDITAGSTSSYTGPVPKFGDQQGGVIQLSDPDDNTTKVGDYSFLITFLDDAIGCVATGAYTFPNGDQVTFAASCSGLVGPLGDFSITGGKGKFSGAGGYVDYMIDAIDSEGVQYGFTHDIHVCSRPHQLE